MTEHQTGMNITNINKYNKKAEYDRTQDKKDKKNTNINQI